MSCFVRLTIITCLGTLAVACGSSSVPPPVIPTGPVSNPAVAAPVDTVAAACLLVAGPGEPIATVALAERVDAANAPHPTNNSERLLFRQLYETLVRIDCEGRPRPSLAASWRLDANGRTWIVTLREDARFSDGTPVMTADVVSSWTSAGGAGGLRSQVSRHVQAIVPVDERSLAITLHNEHADAPLPLADAGLAIARRSPGSRWPLGTRSAQIAPDQARSDRNGRSVITLTGRASGSTSLDTREDPWSVRFLVAPGRDPRDFLDEGVDLLLTRNRATIDYANTLPQFMSVPMAWQRTHVFLSRQRGRLWPQPSAEARETLAREAVRGEARGAEGPFWWRLSECELPDPAAKTATGPATRRIVFDGDDDVSRDLAERLVGLGSAPTAGAPRLNPSGEADTIVDSLVSGSARGSGPIFERAIGLTGEALALAQARGSDAGYVLSFDRRLLDPCPELRAAVDRIGWLDPYAIVPLVDTRLRAIVRRGRAEVRAEWDGGLVIRPASSAR